MRQPDYASERGSILIVVAITLATLMALAAFSVDAGVFWMARAQAQTAADAGALAGATALALDDTTWPIPAGGVVENSATKVAQANLVAGASGVPQVSSSCPPFAPYLAAPFNTGCIRVDVYRDGQFASATLPTYFAHIIGVSSQGIKATATAQVSQANGSGCMRPWFITDKYTDGNANGVYDSPPDVYTPPGYLGTNIGTGVVFRAGGGPSSYGTLDVGAGANAVKDAISNCAPGRTFAVGQTAATQPGAAVGPVKQGIDNLIGWDAGATWNAATHTITGSCADTGSCVCPASAAQCPYGGSMSPRIVQAAICSPTEVDCNSGVGAGTITIINIISFFVTGYTNAGSSVDINAVIISSAGTVVPGVTVAPGASFLTATRLVR